MTAPDRSSRDPLRIGMTLPAVLLLLGGLLVLPGFLEAQAAGGATRMRDFWHVFAAYAIAWLLLFGWAVSIGRRIRSVEEKLDRDR